MIPVRKVLFWGALQYAYLVVGEGRSDASFLLHKLTHHRIRTGNLTSFPKFDLGRFLDSIIDDFLGDSIDQYRIRGSRSWTDQAEFIVERDSDSDSHWRAYGDEWCLC